MPLLPLLSPKDSSGLTVPETTAEMGRERANDLNSPPNTSSGDAVPETMALDGRTLVMEGLRCRRSYCRVDSEMALRFR